MIILKNRCYDALDSCQGQEQAGFRKSYSAIDHIQTISQVLEKTREYNLDIALLFVDFNKAFDSLYHQKIWETLAIQGVQKDIIKILEETYKNSTAQIRLDRTGEPFPIKRG